MFEVNSTDAEVKDRRQISFELFNFNSLLNHKKPLVFWWFKGMLRPIFRIDINIHSDRKWKIM